MSSTFVPVFRLLQAAGLGVDDDYEPLASEMAEHHRVSATTIAGWAAGAPVTTTQHLRALIAVLPVTRRVVFDLIAPAALLPALWCPELGDELARRRTAKGLSRDELATLAGISAATVKRWEDAHTIPRADQLAGLCAVLDVSAAELLAYGEWPPTVSPIGQLPAFAQWLRRVGADLEVSEGKLAKLVGIGQPTMNAWSRGRGFPERQSWKRLTQTFTELGAPLTPEQMRWMQVPERIPGPQLETLPAVARLLVQARLNRAWCREVAAESLGIQVSTLVSWEKGKRAPHFRKWPGLIEVYGLERDAVIDALREDAGETRSDIGAQMRYLRLTVGLTNKQVGDALDVHFNAVHRYECGYLAVPEHLHEAIAETLHVSLDQLDTWALEPDPERVAFGKRLRHLRMARGLTQAQTGELAGLRQQDVATIETGAMPVPPRLRLLLAA